MRVTDKEGARVSLSEAGGGYIGEAYYPGTPGRLDNGLIIDARIEQLPYAKICRTTGYSVSDGFPINEIGFGTNTMSIFIHYGEGGTLLVDNGNYLSQLEQVVNVFNGNRRLTDSAEDRAIQGKYFKLFINGEWVAGTLDCHHVKGQPYATYIFSYDHYYTVDEIKSVRVELSGD